MTEELINKLKAAKTDEERKRILEESGVELTEEEASKISGGCSSCEHDMGK